MPPVIFPPDYQPPKVGVEWVFYAFLAGMLVIPVGLWLVTA